MQFGFLFLLFHGGRVIAIRGRRAAKDIIQPLPTPTAGTDETRRLAAFLIAMLQPPGTSEAWITLDEVSKKVSRQRRYSAREVSDTLRGDIVPPPEIVDVIIRLRAERRDMKNSSRENMKLRDEAQILRSRALASQSAQHGTSPSPGQRPAKRLKKRLSWAAAIAGTAVITLFVTGVIPGILEQFTDGAKLKDEIRPGPDIFINESMYYPNGENGPSPRVASGSYQPSKRLVQALAHPMAAVSPPVQRQIRATGAIDIQNVFIRVLLQSNRNELIRILNIYPVNLRRTSPLGGVLFNTYPQGLDYNIQMAFNLDQASPQALAILKIDRITSQPFFEGRSISLKSGEQRVLIVQANTNCYDAEFSIAVDYVIGSRMHTEVISDNGQPFRVSAYRYNRSGMLSYRQDFEMMGDYSVIPFKSQAVAYPSLLKTIRACPYLSANR